MIVKSMVYLLRFGWPWQGPFDSMFYQGNSICLRKWVNSYILDARLDLEKVFCGLEYLDNFDQQIFVSKFYLKMKYKKITNKIRGGDKNN